MAEPRADARTWEREARTLLLASPRGFCAGVERAIEIVEEALRTEAAPVWVRHEIVHNREVVADLRAKGAYFVDDLDEVPTGALVVFSAHGVSPAIRLAAHERGLRVLDATCPLVAKVHLEVVRYTRAGLHILLVGHRGHVEVEGTFGHAPDRTQVVETVDDAHRVVVPDPTRVAALTQTTLSVDDTRDILEVLQDRFPALRIPSQDDICYATSNRQSAVKELALEAEVVLVVGSETSSNTQRLVEVARAVGAIAHRIENGEQIDPSWIATARRIGVTAGASAPERSVQSVVGRLQALGFDKIEESIFAQENVSFSRPAVPHLEPPR